MTSLLNSVTKTRPILALTKPCALLTQMDESNAKLAPKAIEVTESHACPKGTILVTTPILAILDQNAYWSMVLSHVDLVLPT